MLADGVPQLAWLAWTTPFGLTARAAPYADNRVAPLLVLAGLSVGFGLAGLIAARTSRCGRRTGRGADSPFAAHLRC